MTGSSPRIIPAGDSTFKVYCEICGVGYEASFRVTGRGVRTKATIFPATGSKTISGDVTRRLLALWENANEEYERKGYEVIRESPTVLGVIVENEALRMNGLAVAARNFGFLSILFSPCAIVALICGYMALAQIRERGERGRSEAMTGITIGWIFIGIFILIVILINTH